MHGQKTAIITDSGTDVPEAFVRSHGIRVVPLNISYSNGDHYRAGVDISEKDIVDRLDVEVPTTSLPSPEAILGAFEQARDEGCDSAVFVGISSGLSATCDTARLVASHVEGIRTAVVDTLSIGVAAGMVVMAVAEMLEEGLAFEQTIAAAERLVERTKVFFCVKDLTWLHKGGRIDQMTYRLGSMLNVKPIIWCDEEGHYRTYKKARGWDRALDQLVRCLKPFARQEQEVRVAVACTSACDCFDAMDERIGRELDNVCEMIHSHISAALVVHTGPELVGLGIQPDWHALA